MAEVKVAKWSQVQSAVTKTAEENTDASLALGQVAQRVVFPGKRFESGESVRVVTWHAAWRGLGKKT